MNEQQQPKLQGGKKAAAIILAILAGLIGNAIIMAVAGGLLAGLPLLVGGGLGGLCFGVVAVGTYQGLARVLSR